METFHMMRGAGRTLLLAPEEPDDALEAIPRGVPLRVSITVPRGGKSRSVGHLRKYMALLKVAHEASGLAMPFDQYRKWLAIRAGYFDIAPDGQLIAKSIAFDKMDQDRFTALYKDTLTYLIEHVMGPGTRPDDVEAQVDNLLGFA